MTLCSSRSSWNSKAYKEYYVIAIGEAAPKPKASVRRARSSSDTSITLPTAAASLRLTASVKGKQTAKASKAKSLSAFNEVAKTKAQQLKLVTKRSMQQMHISQPSGSGADEGTGSIPGVPDVPTDVSEEELSWKSTDDEDDKDDAEESGDDDEEGGDDEQEYYKEDDDEETMDEESFDHIPQTPKSSKDEGTGAEDIGLNIEREERLNEEEEKDKLYRDINEAVKVAIQIQSGRLHDEAQRENDEFPRTVDENIKKIIKEQVKEQVKVQVSKILPRIEQAVNEQLEAEVLIRSSHSSRTSYAVAADLSDMELKKKLIEKMKGNKYIQCSDEQRNLYKALVEAYESDKIILDTYGETITLKRRRDDDEDKDKKPFAGPDRGSKRRREGKEPESASAPSEITSRSVSRSTKGSRSRQASASESALAEEPHPEWFSQQQKPPTLDREWNKTLTAVHRSIQPWIIDTLTPKLLVGPTYELMKGSCKSLIELEYHFEEVYKATTDQLDWVNPKGQQYPHNLLQPLLLIPDNRDRLVIPFKDFINNDLEYLRGGASSCKYTTSVTKKKATDYGNIKWIKDSVPRTIWIQEPINYDKHALWGRRIIAVTELKIMKWHSYKHLDWITRRVELQLGVESYQKRLNLTKLDTYRSDLKHKEAYTIYSNPRGFIYQNKDKKNRLMWIDELHKFSEGTLTDVRTALDDRLKGIRMHYLPQTIWRKSDKDRAVALIQAIDKRLKIRRIMKSLERFVGGRLYEGDFKMLQRTI
nr:hypothetical protein [Tanacetum cinerariifolium]